MQWNTTEQWKNIINSRVKDVRHEKNTVGFVYLKFTKGKSKTKTSGVGIRRVASSREDGSSEGEEHLVWDQG